MKRLALATLPILVALGCRQIAGIGSITYSGAEGGASSCTNATAVLTSSAPLALVAVANGFVTAGLLDSSGTLISNVVACPAGTTCSQPKNLLNVGFNDNAQSYAAGAQIDYTLVSGSVGSLHSIAYDGTNDQTLLPNAASPLWIATSGARTFWVSEDVNTGVDSVHCLGCGSGDQTWITNLGPTYGLLADANDVYVIADDGTGSNGVYACATATACNATPRTVITGLTTAPEFAAVQVASDGTNAYVTNDASEILRIGPTGTQTSVTKGVAALAIEVDPTTNDLFYATDSGDVASVKADGTGAPVPLSKCDPGSPNDILDIAFDATNVYVLVAPTTGMATVYAIKRN